MRLLRARVWDWYDLGLLKWCCLLLGVALGAWLGEPARRHAALLAAVGLALGVRPTVVYFRRAPVES